MVFPSRSLRRQLEDAQTKMKEMEKELEMMKGAFGEKRQRLEVNFMVAFDL